VTVFGEHLITAFRTGLVLRHENSFLSTAARANANIRYHPASDSVAQLLKTLKVGACSEAIRGTLRLGWGFAGSSVLATTHLHGAKTLLSRELMMHSEEMTHGFRSSGFDVDAVRRQRHGRLIGGVWEDISSFPFRYSLFGFEKERRMSYGVIKQRILGNIDAFEKSLSTLNRCFDHSWPNFYKALIQYCELLIESRVYSPVVTNLLSLLVAEGVAAKGIGGLYDKAIIVFWPIEEFGCDREERLRERIREFRPLFSDESR
jgi:hypothetical protein